MRLPRLTARRLMVLVVLVAAPLGWMIERRSRFQRQAEFHHSRAGRHWMQFPSRFATAKEGPFEWRMVDPDREPISMRLSNWHDSLAAKYREAAARPWLRVPPDPPVPE